MLGVPDRAHVRLAELVAALSLGVDLGFGQPMEHVLRQTLIALRLGERAGLEEPARVGVFYTALLVNVGCHSDAYEQAKWFGDDIELKATKYGPHDARSLRAVVENMRRIGAGNPPLHRLCVGLAFVLSGHREVEAMIMTHSGLARGLARQLGLPESVCDAVAAAYERWDGRGWPGDLEGEQIPPASRVAQLAEYSEVAQRVGGTEAAVSLARERAERGDADASLALDVYLHRLRAGIAAMAAAMNGLDVVVWTGGVGERAPAIRAAANDGLSFLGLGIDHDRNQTATGDCDLTSSGAAVSTVVVRAREDLEIARQVRELATGGVRI